MFSKTHRRVALRAALASFVAFAVEAYAEPAGSAATWTFSARSIHHGDAVPLDAIGDEDRTLAQLDPRPGRNIAYVDDELRLSRAAGAWTWSVLARSRAVLVTDGSTLDLIRTVAGGTTPSTDRRWSAQARYDAFQGGGLEAGYRFTPAAQWQVGVAAQLMSLRHWRRRTLDGAVQFDAGSSAYAFDLASTQADDRLRFPFQEPRDGGGAALLFAVDARWSDGDWGASLSVRDLGWLRWNGLPQQDATLSTQTQSYDADGFVIYKPLIQGRNGQQGYARSASGWWTARVSRQVGNAAFELSSDWVPRFGALPAVAWRQRFADVDLGLQWRVHERRATVSIGWQGWQLSAGTDRLGAQRRSQELALAGRWPF